MVAKRSIGNKFLKIRVIFGTLFSVLGSSSAYLVYVSTLVQASDHAKPSSMASLQEDKRVVSPTPTVESVPSDPEELLKQFRRAQWNHAKSFAHETRLRLKELKRSLKAREKEWKDNANRERKKFFAENPQGAERRPFMQSLLERRKKFEQDLNTELSEFKKSLDTQRESLKAENLKRLEQFKDFLSKKMTPPQDLWPAARSTDSAKPRD